METELNVLDCIYVLQNLFLYYFIFGRTIAILVRGKKNLTTPPPQPTKLFIFNFKIVFSFVSGFPAIAGQIAVLGYIKCTHKGCKIFLPGLTHVQK